MTIRLNKNFFIMLSSVILIGVGAVVIYYDVGSISTQVLGMFLLFLAGYINVGTSSKSSDNHVTWGEEVKLEGGYIDYDDLSQEKKDRYNQLVEESKRNSVEISKFAVDNNLNPVELMLRLNAVEEEDWDEY